MSVAHLDVGLVYRVSASVASYLISTGCAEVVLEDEVDAHAIEEQQFEVNVKRWRQVAADVTRRPRSNRRRR